MSKKSKNKKTAIVIILIVIIIAAIVAFLYAKGYISLRNPNNKPSESAPSISDNIDSSDNNNENDVIVSGNSPSSENESESSSEEKSSNGTYSASLPLTVNDALDILSEKYGSDYRINMSTQENGIFYFAIFRDDQRYATVKANLSTGEATETITETGKATSFKLV